MKQKLKTLTMGLFLTLSVISSGLSREHIPPFKTVTEGVEFREVLLEHPRAISILQLRCDPGKVRFNLLLGTDRKAQRTATAREMQKAFKQIAVVNSSYFDDRERILGYAERVGQVVNPQVAEDGIFSAFFYWDGRRAGFKRRGEALPKNVPVLFQSGPRLVWDSEAVFRLEETALANRSVLSVDDSGRVSIFVIGGASRVTLAELPKLLMAPVDKGGVSSRRALNLDGGKSTQFCLHTPQKKTYLPVFVSVPVFLGVSRK